MTGSREDDARTHWDSVYRSSSAERLSWYQMHPVESLAMIEVTGIAKEAPIIDVGGGASRLGECLFESGYFSLTVLDCSEEVLELARQRMGPRAEKISWIRADVRSFRTDTVFRLWHDRAVFHFMVSEEDRRRYIDTLDASLDENGIAIIGTFAPTGPERCSRLPVERYDADRIAETFAPKFDLVASEFFVHQTPSGVSQDFMFFTFHRYGQ